jgi:hypothetical protein
LEDKNMSIIMSDVKTDKERENDKGKHYRYSYKGINLDPFRIARIYEVDSFAMMTVLKKCLCAGERGHKDYKEDLLDIINACERELEMINEDDL